MKLLISTPHYILDYDVKTKKVEILESGMGEYYGITWDLLGKTLAISCSGINNSTLLNLEAYATSVKGRISVGGYKSWEFLSGPHQIQWVDDHYILATNTGQNALTRYSMLDQGIVNFRYDDVLWDRLTPQGREGAHFNSIFKREDRVFLVAHNFDKGSYILELDWPSLEQISDARKLNVSGIHNLWITPEGEWVVCDSKAGTLVDGISGEVIWSNNLQGFTRGLAACGKTLFVGNSEMTSQRDIRTKSESGLWVINCGIWETIDFIPLGEFGGVHEVRIYDQPDECHHGGLLHPNALSVLNGPSDKTPLNIYQNSETLEKSRAEKLRFALLPRLDKNRKWNTEIANITPRFNKGGLINMPANGFAILSLKDENKKENLRIEAHLHLVGSNPNDHASLIARYLGPGDQHMCAALFQFHGALLTASIWENAGQWKRIEGRSFQFTHANLLNNNNNLIPEPEDTIESIPVEFAVNSSKAEIKFGVIGNVKAQLLMPTQKGKAGIRLFGNSLGFSSVKIRECSE